MVYRTALLPGLLLVALLLPACESQRGRDEKQPLVAQAPLAAAEAFCATREFGPTGLREVYLTEQTRPDELPRVRFGDFQRLFATYYPLNCCPQDTTYVRTAWYGLAARRARYCAPVLYAAMDDYTALLLVTANAAGKPLARLVLAGGPNQQPVTDRRRGKLFYHPVRRTTFVADTSLLVRERRDYWTLDGQQRLFADSLRWRYRIRPDGTLRLVRRDSFRLKEHSRRRLAQAR